MSGSSGGDNNQGKGFYFLLLALFGVVVFVFGLYHKELFVVLFGGGCVAFAIVVVTIRYTDSRKNDEQRRADAESSQLRNMKRPPPKPTLKKGKKKWVKHQMTSGESVPGSADLHVSHHEYHGLATRKRYQGKAFEESGDHVLDIRNEKREKRESGGSGGSPGGSRSHRSGRSSGSRGGGRG